MKSIPTERLFLVVVIPPAIGSIVILGWDTVAEAWLTGMPSLSDLLDTSFVIGFATLYLFSCGLMAVVGIPILVVLHARQFQNAFIYGAVGALVAVGLYLLFAGHRISYVRLPFFLGQFAGGAATGWAVHKIAYTR